MYKLREMTKRGKKSENQTHKYGQIQVPDSSSGTGPQEIQSSYANTSTEHLLNSAIFGDQQDWQKISGKLKTIW